MYRRVISLVNEKLGSGLLLAGPDCPEVYFFENRFSMSGAIFDFFSASGSDFIDAAMRPGTTVVVANHQPRFTPALSAAALARLRSLFPNGEMVGHFEVRWH